MEVNTSQTAARQVPTNHMLKSTISTNSSGLCIGKGAVHASHEPLDRAAGHGYTLSVHLHPDLVGAVNLHVGVPDTLDMGNQFIVTLGACTAQLRLALLHRVAPVARRGTQPVAGICPPFPKLPPELLQPAPPLYLLPREMQGR